jgi:hypothetical protein
MYKVYWTENGNLNAKEFASGEMSTALDATQQLRTRQYAGEDIQFIVMAHENPHSVGKQGYDVTGPDYDWKKRRI